MEWNDAEFGKRLKAARLAANMTQVDVAALFDMKAGATVGHWETGTNQPTAAQVARMAAEFGADPTYLLFGDAVPPKVKAASGARVIMDARALTLATEFATLPERLNGKTRTELFGTILQMLVSERHASAPAQLVGQTPEAPPPPAAPTRAPRRAARKPRATARAR